MFPTCDHICLQAASAGPAHLSTPEKVTAPAADTYAAYVVNKAANYDVVNEVSLIHWHEHFFQFGIFKRTRESCNTYTSL